ncbi:MAG: hypothetical protein WC371_05220, partial [Parachlamydiales bacterium]
LSLTGVGPPAASSSAPPPPALTTTVSLIKKVAEKKFASKREFKIFFSTEAQDAFFEQKALAGYKQLKETKELSWKLSRKRQKKIAERLDQIPVAPQKLRKFLTRTWDLIRNGLKKSKTGGRTPIETAITPDQTISALFPKKTEKEIKPILKFTQHPFYDSQFNHSGHLERQPDGSLKFVYVENAMESSMERVAEDLQMSRVAIDNQGQTIFYTGRPETEKKARELFEHIVQTEFSAPEGSRRLHYNPATKKWELPVLINSVVTPSRIYNFLDVVENEKTITLDEESLMQRLHGQVQTCKVTKPDGSEEEIQVEIKPFFFCNLFNRWASRKTTLLGIGGQKTAQKLSEFGRDRLKEYITSAKATKVPPLTALQTTMLDQAVSYLDRTDPDPAKDSITQLIARAFIAELLNLPFVAHCKSSIDRTALAVALAAAVHQIVKGNSDGKRDSGSLSAFQDAQGNFSPDALLDQDGFKNLVISNALAGLPFTEIARGRPGFKWSKQILRFFKTPENRELLKKLKAPKGLSG